MGDVDSGRPLLCMSYNASPNFQGNLKETTVLKPFIKCRLLPKGTDGNLRRADCEVPCEFGGT